MEMLITPKQILDARYYAHTRDKNGEKEKETLLAHSRLTLHYYERYCDKKGIDKIVRELIKTCGFRGEEAEIVYLLFVYAIYLHDFGKINPRYQYDVLDNNKFRKMRDQATDSNHALASAYLYIDHMYRIFSKNQTSAMEKCIAAFAYCISKHHGKLDDGKEFDKLNGFDEKYCNSQLDDSVFENIRYYMRSKILLPIPASISCDCCMRLL